MALRSSPIPGRGTTFPRDPHVGRCPGARERAGESLPGAAGATDLGGSSNYSSVILEVRCGVSFLDNRICSRVSRSLAPGVKTDKPPLCPVGNRWDVLGQPGAKGKQVNIPAPLCLLCTGQPTQCLGDPDPSFGEKSLFSTSSTPPWLSTHHAELRGEAGESTIYSIGIRSDGEGLEKPGRYYAQEGLGVPVLISASGPRGAQPFDTRIM